MDKPNNVVEIRKILDLLPHRYPVLLEARVLEYERQKYIRAVKNVTFNEPQFMGHFPGLPVMPGVLILEAMAQTGGILVAMEMDVSNKIFMFTGIEKVRFRRPVSPGDQLIMECSDVKHKLKLIRMNARATVDGEIAAEAILTAAVLEKEDM